MNVISLSYVSVQILQKVEISASLPDPKGQRIMVIVYNHDDTAVLLQFNLSKILVNVVSSDHRVYSTSDSISHAIACDNFMRSRNLVIGLLRRYTIIADITAGL